jgi:aryl-alcohol dehydrogenase-like predicted oxidoreductase
VHLLRHGGGLWRGRQRGTCRPRPGAHPRPGGDRHEVPRRRPTTRGELAQQIRVHLEASLARLGTNHVELCYWSRRLERIKENLSAADVELTDAEFARIEAELAKVEVYGNRTDEDIAKLRHLD